MATHGRFGPLGQYEVSENDPNEFPMSQNLGIDTKIKYLAYLEPKLQIWPFQLLLGWPKMATNCCFGHLGHSGMSENGPNEFPMP